MLEQKDHENIRELRLARPPANALNPEMITTLRGAIQQAQSSSAAIVLSGAPGMFSGGLDLVELVAFERNEVHHLWTEFFDLLRTIASSEIPICCAITGHSPAGGAVMAMFGDYRVMASGNFKIGLNEVQVGMPLPDPLHSALCYLVGPRHAERLAVGGLLIKPDEALRIGLVDELVEPEQVIERSISWCKGQLKLPSGARQATRRLARKQLVDVFSMLDGDVFQRFVDAWFTDEAQAAMQAIVTRLKKRG